ncbi:hypothetical protein MNEG_16600, partial [Monoraphidium neglectum]
DLHQGLRGGARAGPQAQAHEEGEALREIAALPDWARPAFAGMEPLNRLQSAVCDAALSAERTCSSAPPR